MAVIVTTISRYLSHKAFSVEYSERPTDVTFEDEASSGVRQ
jgi:hypothetical protein